MKKMIANKKIKIGMKKIIEWFLVVLPLNSDRKKMMIFPNMTKLFSPGFTFNILKLIMIFSKPFIEDTQKIREKVGKVDPIVITNQ